MMTSLELVFSKIQENQTIKKYSQIYSTDMLEIMNFEDSFKWSNYFWYISKIANTLNQNSRNTLYGVELLGLAARLLDDFLDKDTLLSTIVSSEHLSLFSTELLVESLELIGNNFCFDYCLLKEALHAECMDHSTTITTHSSIDFYFENILPKSTALFRLITKLASEGNLLLDQFAMHYGTLVQIKNDVAGIFENPSADITKQKSTLPLIASVNTFDTMSNQHLLSLLHDSETQKKIIQTRITQTGALDFCEELITSEKAKALSILNQFSETKYIPELKQYLRLEA